MFELKITAKTPAELLAALADYMVIAEARGHSVTTGPAADVAAPVVAAVSAVPAGAAIVLHGDPVTQTPPIDGMTTAGVVVAPVVSPAAAAMATAAAADSTLATIGADFAAQGEEPAADVLVDKAGTPWDSRIHTSNKGTKQNGEWKRKPSIADELYNSVLAEITAAGPAVEPVAGDLPQIAPAVIATQTTPTQAPAATEVAPVITPPAPAGEGCDLNTVTAAATTLVTTATQVPALGGAIGAAMLGAILTAYGAVGASPDGTTPGAPMIGALDLAHYPAFVQTCGALVTNLASCTPENYVSMIDTLLVRA